MEMAEQAESWFRKRLISSEEYVHLRSMYVGGYTDPKLLPRVGHFIFASLIVWSALGILLLAIGAGGVKACGGMAFVYGLALYGAAGMYLKENKHYRSGITHAMLFFALLCIFAGLTVMITGDQGDPVMWMVYLPASIGLVFTSIRFISSFFALLAWMCFAAFVILLLFRMGAIGKAIAPFLMMALSGGLYVFLRKKKAVKEWMLWSRLLDVLEAAAVFTFYLSGNYYVVREMSGFDIYSYSKSEIPLAWFFYSFTVLVPLAYLIAGLTRKNRLLLHAGLICSVLAVASIRYYHSFLPADIALTGVGIFLTALAWWAIRFLHKAKGGITSQADPDAQESNDEKQALKSLNQMIISGAATGSHTPQSDASPDDVSFGGGSGGGGGAGLDF
jgi:hypothetical protein